MTKRRTTGRGRRDDDAGKCRVAKAHGVGGPRGGRRPQAARLAGGPPMKRPYGRFRGGPPTGHRKVGYGIPNETSRSPWQPLAIRLCWSPQIGISFCLWPSKYVSGFKLRSICSPGCLLSFATLPRAVFPVGSRGFSKVSLGHAIPYHCRPCGRATQRVNALFCSKDPPGLPVECGPDTSTFFFPGCRVRLVSRGARR
jgi:hypothetical protein